MERTMAFGIAWDDYYNVEVRRELGLPSIPDTMSLLPYDMGLPTSRGKVAGFCPMS